jgi:hypothetical protein
LGGVWVGVLGCPVVWASVGLVVVVDPLGGGGREVALIAAAGGGMLGDRCHLGHQVAVGVQVIVRPVPRGLRREGEGQGQGGCPRSRCSSRVVMVRGCAM